MSGSRRKGIRPPPLHDHVRLDPHLLVGEQRPRAPETALDLVEDEGDVARLRHGSQLTQESVVDDAHTAFTLDWFDDQGGDRVLVERGVQLLEVAFEDRDARRERAEGQPVAGTVGRRERPEQPTVERAAQRDDLVLRLAQRARPSTRELEGAFVRLGARVAEEHLRRERPCDEGRREPLARCRVIQVRGMDQPFGRGMQCPLEAGIVVAERVHGDAAAEVEIGLPLGVVHVHAASANELDWGALVGAKDRAFERARGGSAVRARWGGRVGRRLQRWCGHTAMLPTRVSTVPRCPSVIAEMSEIRTRCTPPSSAERAACSLAAIPPRAVPSSMRR